MKFFRSLAVVLVVSAAAAVAAPDVTGKWPGTIEFANPDGGSRSEPALVVLKQEGETVTGTGGPNESEQHPIQNAKLQGDRLTFEIVTGSGRTMRFDLKVAGDKIEGEVQGESRDGGKRTARLSVKRVAEK